MSRPLLLLDLDGTLLDVSRRYAALHRDGVASCKAQPMARRSYWIAKRQGRSERDILTRSLRLTDEQATAVIAFRDRRIESPEYLRRDRPWPWTRDCLKRLATAADLVLFTLRRSREALERQLGELELLGHFSQIVNAPRKFRDGSKSALAVNAGVDLARCRGLIGDTEVDIAAGESLGVLSLAVGCGLRSRRFLSGYRPSQIFADLRGATRWLVANGLLGDAEIRARSTSSARRTARLSQRHPRRA